MSVIVGDLINRSNVADDATLNLGFPFGLEAVRIGKRTFIYNISYNDHGLDGFQIKADGSLAHVAGAKIDDSGSLLLGGLSNLISGAVGDTHFLFTHAYSSEYGVSVFRIDSDGALINTDNVVDNATLELNSGRGQPAFTTVGDDGFLIASSESDNGFSVFHVSASGQLLNNANIVDAANPLFALAGARDVATATIDSSTFIFVAGSSDDGVTSFRLSGDGSATFADSVFDTESINLQLDGATGIATTTVGGTTFLSVSGIDDDGVSVFSVSATGQLTNVFNIEGAQYDQAWGLEAFTIDGGNFLSLTSRTGSTLALFNLADDGVLRQVQLVSDASNAQFLLSGAVYSAFGQAKGHGFLVADGTADNGLSVFELGGANDTLKGAGGDDSIFGFSGDDNLTGKGGIDFLSGGSGDDVLKGGRGADHLLGGAGHDELYGGKGDTKDVFEFTSKSDTTKSSSSWDQILDFDRKSGGEKTYDRIDLSAIDADTSKDGDQKFRWQNDGFDKVHGDEAKGQVFIDESGHGVKVKIDYNGDGKTDDVIQVVNVTELHQADFIL